MKNVVQQCYDNPNEGNQVSIGILGDVDCSTWKNNGHNPLLALKPLFEKTDVVVANVETVISDDPLKPVKRGIILKSPTCLARMLKEVGVDVALLANNHIDDFGREGALATVHYLSQEGIKTFGLNGSNDLKVSCKGMDFQFSGYCTPWQGDAVVSPYGRSPGGVIKRKRDGEYHWLYFVHGFEELYSVPFPWRVDLLKAIADGLKPSAVVCGHSHVYQGWFRQNGIPVCLSYGNGFMNLAYHEKANPKSRIGCYSVLNFDENGCRSIDEHYFRIKPDGIVELSGTEETACRKDLKEMHQILDDESELRDAWESACYQAWEPKGWKNLPLLRGLYDWHRRVKVYDQMQRGATFNRAIHAAYLKRQYDMNVFRLRDDERIHLEG